MTSLAEASPEVRARVVTRLTPRLNEFIPITPTTKQAAYLCLDDYREVFYGGAAAGAKTTAILAAALQYVDVPGYHAVLLRRNYKQLSMPGSWIPKAHDWLDHTAARWHEGGKRWTFPSGSTLTFGFVGQQQDDWRKFESAEFSFIGIDEVTAWREQDYRNLFSRLRHNTTVEAPLRMRCASNPGGRGHEWVKTRFVNPKTRNERAVFIPAYLTDNPHVDYEEYVASLIETHPTTWQRLLHGDWDAADPGEMFQPRVWLGDEHFLDEAPKLGVVARVRYYDLAAAEPTSQNPDPDYTVGAKFSRLHDGTVVVEHVLRFRRTPGQVEKAVHDTMISDGTGTSCWIEKAGGAGVALYDHFSRNVTPDPVKYRMVGDHVAGRGAKAVRARPFASAMEAGKVLIVRGPWNEPLFDELEAFSEDPQQSGAHDDQVDACSGAYYAVQRAGKAKTSKRRVADAML